MKKVLKALLLTVLAYLIQTCVMPQLKIGGVVANVIIANIAILTVSLGKKYAFGSSCLSGILLEATTYSVGGLYVVIYPVISMIFSYIFADMSDEKREKRMLMHPDNQKKLRGDLNPHLRIPLNAICVSAVIETVYLVYISLNGTVLTAHLIGRGLLSVLYTGAVTLLIMVPVRYFLGMYGHRVKRAMTDEKQG